MATVAVVLLGVAAVLGRGSGPGGDDHVVYHNRVANVTRTIDAFSFEIDTPDRGRERTLVRLCGLAMHDRGETGDGSVGLSPDSRVRLLLPPSRTRDAEGLLQAYVVLDESNEHLNERLLAEGVARADRDLDHPLKSKFIALERRARQRGAGHWAKAAPQVHASTTP